MGNKGKKLFYVLLLGSLLLSLVGCSVTGEKNGDEKQVARGDTGIHEWLIDENVRRIIRTNYTDHTAGI